MANFGSSSIDILPREKWWWLALALLLMLAGWLYYRGYMGSLPFLDHVDEPNHLLSAQHLIDEGSARNPLWYDAYPPGMYHLQYLLLHHVKPPEQHFISVLPTARLITITVWLLAFVLIALIGYQMAHALTGLMAAAIYLVNPWIVERARYALPDGHLTFFTLLALWLALIGYRHGRRSFSTASVYSIMLAIVFKTQAIFVAPIMLLLPLLNWWRLPALRQDAWQQTFWNCVRFGFFLFWLLFIYRTLEADNIPNWVAPSDSIASSPFVNIHAHLLLTLDQFQSSAGWLASLICGLTLWRYRRGTAPFAILAVLLAALSLLVGSSLFGRQSLRQFYTFGALLSLLYAVGLTGLMYLLSETLTKLPVLSSSSSLSGLRALLSAGLVVSLLATSLLPAYRESDALAHNFSLPDRRNDLAIYMDTSLSPGKYITDRVDPNHKTFNRSWGGYTGLHDFPLAKWTWHLLEQPLETWRENDAVYAIVPYTDDPDSYFPGNTVRLKGYPPDSNFRDPGMVVLRLYPIQHPHYGQLGPIQLVGYDINATQLQAGEELVFRHYWQAETPTGSAQHVYNHLLDENDEIVAQADYVPLWDNRRDTTTWDDPDEIMLGREFTLSLPPDLAPGAYKLVSGLYDPQTWQRLQSPDGSDRLVIAEIGVQAPSP